jgi:putative oxidoreductase
MSAIVGLVERTFHFVQEKLGWVGPTLARVVVGWVFLESGWGKLHNLDKVIGFFTELGIPAPQLQAPFVATVELVGGLCLLLGLATRLISVPLSFTMVVAIATAKKDELHELSDLFAMSEFLYIALMAWLIVASAGPLSVDRLIANKLRQRGDAG